jgi:ABC-type nitrate/sulfonate/bicarbonate transport system substrate-binding protein
MTNVPLTVGCMEYDRTRYLIDGTVPIAGADATFKGAALVSDIFENMVAHRAYDVAELGLGVYLRTLEQDDPPFVALPVFPNRHFRHSAIYVNTASGISEPADLAGRTIGEFAMYGHDAGIWPKGILSDEYGVTPEQSKWVIGGTDRPLPPFDYLGDLIPANVDVVAAPEGRALGPMLEAGEIDALISALVPRAIREGSPKVAPLFADPEAAERDYFRRTGIFPIMHTVVVRKDTLAGNPGLARSIYEAFHTAKDVAVEHYRHAEAEQHADLMVPWFSTVYEKNRATLPDDWWPYGVGKNRAAIETFARYAVEQGLTSHLFSCEELFAPELLDT